MQMQSLGRSQGMFQTCKTPSVRHSARAGRGCAPQPPQHHQHPQRHALAVTHPSSILDSSAGSCDALDSDDLVYAAVPLRRAAALQLQHQQQHQHAPDLHLQQISLAAAEHCYPWIAVAYTAAAAGLLAAPQHAVQLFGGAASASADPLFVTFAQLLGGKYLLQAAVALVVKGCAERGQLNSTTCQRLLLASLLAMTGNIMSLGKVAVGAASPAPAVWLAALLATFCAHVACHLPHHPWFLLKVLWPVATTMVLTDILHLLPAVMALLAALLSVKAISKLSRLAAGAAPRALKRLLGPASGWLARRASCLLPVLARRLGGAAPKITRLAVRAAPRYAKDQLAGHTMHMAFHDADAGMTQTVAKSIDLLPPKTATGFIYTALLALQLVMIANAYSPGLLFILPAALEAAAAAAAVPAGAAAASLAAGTSAASTATTAAAAVAEAAVGISDPVLRLVKYAWGSGFFVAAFACNALKTAADRHHSWAPQNRQLAAALGAMQAVTAWALFTGTRSGAVLPGPYAWCSIGAAAAGACFCWCQAAASDGAQQWAGSAAGSAAGSVLSNSMQGEAQQATVLRPSQPQQQLVVMSAVGAAAVSAAAAAECSAGLPLSSAECERREHVEPEYAAFTSAAVLLLTLLQLAL